MSNHIKEAFNIYKFGIDPDLDAWLTNFYTENHLSYETFPDLVASPEQLNFVIYMDGEQFYYPCPDKLFSAIIEKRADTLLTTAYSEIWHRLEKLVSLVVDNEHKQKYLLSLLSIKFQHETSSKVLLPSRLEKRLLQIFTTISEISRPLNLAKETENHRAFRFLQSDIYLNALNSPQNLDFHHTNLDDITLQVYLLKLQRLFILSTNKQIWARDDLPSQADMNQFLSAVDLDNKNTTTEEWLWFRNWLAEVIRDKANPCILWIGSKSGEIIFDLAIIEILNQMGIKVILSVKQSFFYRLITLADLFEDPVLYEMTGNAEIITNAKLSKNTLLNSLNQNSLLIIPDGTSEQLNPLLTSVTFARAFKEADLIINRCKKNTKCINNHFLFTRDFLSFIRRKEGKLSTELKKHHPDVIRFSEQELRDKADSLIFMLRKAKDSGKFVMFYSAIVGSIPGQLETAQKILNTFVRHLRSTLHGVVIINPGEHFEEGMDADDIMYTWEICQRSGLIDIWRFQTVTDIEKSFQILGEKVPPEWTGKDATYSTGCTKEMKIALEMQQLYPEMQLIGPSWQKFQRRKDYGVGKLYDRVLSD